MGFKDEMAAYDQEFADTEAAPDTGGRLPDGTHQVQITECRIEENSNGFAMVMKFNSNAGQHAGKGIRKWYGLPPTEKQAEYYKRDFLRFGYEGTISGLEEWCESEVILGVMAEIFIKTNPGTDRDFTDVYINSVYLDEKLPIGEGGQFVPAGRAGADADFQDTDDDIPF